MNVWRWLVLAYAGLYAILGLAIHADNLRLDYPAPFIVFSALAQCCITVGIVLFALGREAHAFRIWRWLFPLLVIDLFIGVMLDATIPTDFSLSTHGFAWIANLLFNLWLVAPGYYFNFKLARYGS